MDRRYFSPGKWVSGARWRVRRLLLRIVESRAWGLQKCSGKVVVAREVQGIENAAFSGKNAVGFGASFTERIKIGYGTTIGPFNVLVGPIIIGNYCQLGPAVGIYGKDHPTAHVTTYFNQTLFDGRLKRHAVAQDVLIGDGVWIGHGAVVLKGVQIGRGAVIGAGAVVTSEVPDYAIVVGNPARVLRMRFDEEVAEMLTQTQWWLKSGEDLKPYEELFHVDFNENRQKGLEILKQMIQLANSNCKASSKVRPTGAT